MGINDPDINDLPVYQRYIKMIAAWLKASIGLDPGLRRDEKGDEEDDGDEGSGAPELPPGGSYVDISSQLAKVLAAFKQLFGDHLPEGALDAKHLNTANANEAHRYLEAKEKAVQEAREKEEEERKKRMEEEPEPGPDNDLSPGQSMGGPRPH